MPLATLWVAPGFAMLACALLREAVLGGRILFQRDINMWWWPQVEAFVRTIASGAWPLWNAERGFGQPMLADPSAQVYYPFNWLNLVLLPGTCYTTLVIVHLTASALGVYRLARGWQLSRFAAWTGGAIWLAGGPFFSLVSLWHHLAGAAWIPWLFFAADRLAIAPRPRRAAGLAAALAGQILAGSADMVAMSWLSLAAYVAWRHFDWNEVRAQRNRSLAFASASAFALAIGLTAAQWLPTLEAARRSERIELNEASRTVWSLPLASVPESALRFRWSRLPLTPPALAAILDGREPWLASIYLGMPVLMLLVAGVATPTRAPRSFLLATGVAATLVALGPRFGLYNVLLWMLPPLRMLRFPVKAMVLASFAVASLAAAGVDAFRIGPGSGRGRRRSLVVVAALILSGVALLAAGRAWEGRLFESFLAAGPWLAGARAALASELAFGAALACLGAAVVALGVGRRRPLGLALAALALVDLVTFHHDLHAAAAKELWSHRPETLALLPPPRDARVFVYDYSMRTPTQPDAPAGGDAYRLARRPAGWGPVESVVLAAHLYLNPPTAGRWGVAGSYDLDMLGLYPAPLTRLVELLRETEGTPTHLRLLQMGAVTHAIALLPAAWWRDLQPVGSVPGLFERPIQVMRVPDALPRAYAVGGTRIADGDDAWSALQDPAFDPRREVLLPEGQKVSSTRQAVPCPVDQSRADRVRIQASLDAPGHVVFVQAYDPGWRATVDGRPAAVLRANVAFCAVAVAAGRHEIVLTYRPFSVAVGLWLSAASLAAAFGACVAGRRLEAPLSASAPAPGS